MNCELDTLSLFLLIPPSPTNLWQQQQLLRPSLLRPEVETLLLLSKLQDSSAMRTLRCSVLCCAVFPAMVSNFFSLLMYLYVLLLKFRSSPWSQASTQAKTTTGMTTIIMTRGESKLRWSSHLSSVSLWSREFNWCPLVNLKVKVMPLRQNYISQAPDTHTHTEWSFGLESNVGKFKMMG